MKRRLLALTLPFVLAGCADTDECKRLRAVLEARTQILQSARAQAGALPVIEKRAASAEAASHKVMSSLWLNEPESKVHETLEKRTKAIPGASMSRGTTQTTIGPPEDEVAVSETLWTIRFRDAAFEQAFLNLELLMSNPPLVKFHSLIREKKGDGWRVELIRAAVDQVPINPQPIQIPPPQDLSGVSRQLGFCGAGKLRDDIEAVDGELRSIKERAEKTTVLLPAAASWDGLRGRAELVRDTELENRRHLKVFRDAVVQGELVLKAVGVEGELVFLEIYGGKKELARLELEVGRLGMGGAMKVAEKAPDGVIRVMLANTIEAARRARGGERWGRPLAPGEDLPADHPDARAKKAREQGR